MTGGNIISPWRRRESLPNGICPISKNPLTPKFPFININVREFVVALFITLDGSEYKEHAFKLNEIDLTDIYIETKSEAMKWGI